MSWRIYSTSMQTVLFTVMLGSGGVCEGEYYTVLHLGINCILIALRNPSFKCSTFPPHQPSRERGNIWIWVIAEFRIFSHQTRWFTWLENMYLFFIWLYRPFWLVKLQSKQIAAIIKAIRAENPVTLMQLKMYVRFWDIGDGSINMARLWQITCLIHEKVILICN